MELNANLDKRLFSKPIFIVSAPRSGSTLLFETLIKSSNLWSIRTESHGIYAKFPELTYENDAADSGCLTESHYSPEVANQFKNEYLQQLKNYKGFSFTKLDKKHRPNRVQFIEKTPRNSLNIPFLRKMFPDARFIYLHRKPEENINSIIDGWERKGSFVRFTNLPDWPLGYWCFLLPRGWRSMKSRSIADIAAFQWSACNEKIMADLRPLPKNDVVKISYSQLIDKTPATVKRICDAFNISMDKELYSTITAGKLPLSSTTVSVPSNDKWLSRKEQIIDVIPSVETTLKAIEAFPND